MNTYKMYKLERAAQLYKDIAINESEKIANICLAADIQKPNKDVINYIRGALAIPYNDMLVIIHDYGDTFIEETKTGRFVDRVCKEYGTTPEVVIKRFGYVDDLANSLFFKKKIAGFYNEINRRENKMRVK